MVATNVAETSLTIAGIAFIGAQALGGVTVRDGWTGLVIAILFSILNAILGVPLKAVLLFLGTPLVILSLGLFALLINVGVNAALLRALSFVIGKDRFEIEGWTPALIFGVFFSIGQVVLRFLT